MLLPFIELCGKPNIKIKTLEGLTMTNRKCNLRKKTFKKTIMLNALNMLAKYKDKKSPRQSLQSSGTR